MIVSGILHAERKPDGIQNFTLRHAQLTGKIKMCAHQDNQEGKSPDKIIRLLNKR